MKTRTRFGVHLAVVGLLLMFCNCSSGPNHPSDKCMLEFWQAHKTEFEQLLQMFLADKDLGRVAYSFTRPEDAASAGVTAERLSDYRRRFSALNLTAGIEGYDEKDTVWFHASTYGLSVTGSGKGYAYSKVKPAILVEDLDKYWSKDGRSFIACRRIEGDWYLYFDYED